MRLACTLLLVCLAAATGCSGRGETRSAAKVNAALLQAGMLEEHGLAFLTPTARSDYNEDKQALALVFASTLSDLRPTVRIVPLTQTLGAVNRAGLIQQYQRMYQTFAATGALERDTLAKLRGVTGARYFALLQLSEFSQPHANPAAIALPTRSAPMAHIRLFVQIWDSVDGTAAWEGVVEVNHAADGAHAANVTFSALVERAARDLVVRLP
jgi:hypothetical protein